jgi:hypothetical protein
MPSISPDYRLHDSQTSQLLSLTRTLAGLPIIVQKLVAEIVLLRLFSLFENLVSSVPAKLVAGATFVDGTTPILLTSARSSLGAQTLFRSHGRTRLRNQLPWSKAAEIKENVRHVIDARDNYVTVIDRNGVFIDEMRRVRNRIAHNNSKSRSNYRQVVRGYYGAYLNHMTPGSLLLSPRLTPCLLDQYILRTRVLARDLVKA